MVVPTMAAVTVDVPVAPGAPALPAPVLATTVDVPAPVAAPAASAGRAAPMLAVVPIAATAFAVADAPEAPVQPAPAPAAPVVTLVDLPVAPATLAMPVVGLSSSDAIVQDEKRVFYWLFTYLQVLLS